MKKTMLYLFLIVMANFKAISQPSASASAAENESYMQVMKMNIKSIDTVTGKQSLLAIANNFERIAKAEKNKWEPYYYTAFCYAVMAGMADKNSIDMLADIADKHLNTAKQLNDNSETTVLTAMIIANRILADPMNRFMERGREVIELLDKAKLQDSKNPRPYYLQARFLVKVPQGMGGGKNIAVANLETAIEKFKNFTAADSLAPDWGYTKAAAMLETLKKE